MSRCHTSKKEYHECTDTMARMKNKINETKECLQCVFREYEGAINRPLQWVFAGAWDGTEILTGTIRGKGIRVRIEGK